MTHGAFINHYPVPCVKPYAGRVVVTQTSCDGESGLRATTDIVVGDARAMETGP